MARPPYLLRHTSYRQAESAGQPISTSQLDAEFNDGYEVTNQINRLMRGITDATGKLINISAQLAQSLVGSTRFTPTVATTVFLTTVTWDASFSVGNVQVIANGVIIDTATYAVADNGGFLEVTVAVSVDVGWVFISAYSQGAGIATMLASTAPGDGASQVGIEDVDALYISTNVEGALAEIATSFNALLTTLGTLNKIWTNDGVTVAGGPAANHFQMGNKRVIDMADAINAQDAVTLQQLLSITQNLATLLGQFIRADGNVPWTQNQSVGGNRLTDLAAPVNAGDAVNKTYADAVAASAAALCLALNGLKTSPTRGTLTGPVTLGQLASAVADVDQTTTPGAVIVHTLTGVPRPSALDQVTNKKYVDDAISAALSDSNLSGVGIDGTGLGVPVASIVGGVYEFVVLTITVAQPTLVAPVEIFSEGDITINAGVNMLASDYTIKLRAGGNITILGDINCRGLDVRCVGNLTLGGTISANRGFPTLGDQQNDWDSVCAFRFKCGGNLNDGGAILDARDIFGYVAGDAVISGAWTSLWTAKITGANLDGLSWPYFPFGPAAPRTAGAGGGQHGASDAVGGSGGTGGGHGGSFNGGGFGASDPYRGTARLSLLDIKLLRGGSSGGCGTSGASGYAGGRISLYVAGDAVCTGAVLSSVGGATGGGGGNDPGGGGAGVVRAVVGKTLTDGSFTADGGNGAFSRGGGGGGGGSLLAADTFAGVQAQTVNSAGFIGGLTGTIETAVIPTVDIVALALTGIFDV